MSCFCPFKYFFCGRFGLAEENLIGEVTEPVEHYDLLSIVIICLGGPEQENYSGILRMLDVLLSHETSEAEKKRILRDNYGIPMTEAIEREVSVMCNLSKGRIEEVEQERRIPFEIAADADPFYSESNIHYLEQKMADYKAGRLKLAEHELSDE